MFKQVTGSGFIQGEHEMLHLWQEKSIFEKLRRKNAAGTEWSFLDGPITANNPMGVHHAWGRTYKDAYQRFHAMRGNRLRYQNGFDCQGLWVEIEVEKELGLKTREDVAKLGIDQFVNACKRRVLQYAARQTEQSVRLGYWMDWDDPDQLRKLAAALGNDDSVEFTTPSGEQVDGPPQQLIGRLGNPEWGGSYFTFSTENNETIWTFLKKCHQRGKVYRGSDVMPWSGRAGCAYSQMEVADGRKLTVHRALFVRYPLQDRENEYLLIWTTTPWTLTSNVSVAINTELNYAKVRAHRDDAIYYLAEENLEYARLASEFKDGFGRAEWKWPDNVPKLKTLAQIFKEQGGFTVEGVVKGAELVGWKYRGPFDELPAQQAPGGYPAVFRCTNAAGDVAPSAVESHRVLDGGRDSKGNPVVVAGEGTGIVHTAPGCGDIDYQIGRDAHVARIAPLDTAARFLDDFGDFSGKLAVAPETVDAVIDSLREKGLLFYVEQYPHIYPHCWRTGDELVFRLVDEWFIQMDWREEIKDVVRQIRWLPASIDGQTRELEWLTNMGDWMISKKRFWGLALPIWFEEYQDETGNPQLDIEVIGSLDELREKAVEGWDGFDGQTPHRPWLDGVKIRNPKTGRLMHRVADVGNPWLDAGIVPFSTMHYNTAPDEWQRWYPADLVLECFPGQFRNWFYALLAMATMMDQSRPFKTLIGHALVMNEEGKPMHKSDGTAIWFEEAAEQLGVDTMRWMYLAQPPAVDLRFGTRHKDEPVTVMTPVGEATHTPDGAQICKVVSKPADEVRRRVLIPLWNCYAFFVNYADLDKFDPTVAEVPIAERPEIDRWVLSNLQTLIETCNRGFDAFNANEVCRAIEQFIDDLSNWYVRRNRNRFWRSQSASDQDKLAAYQTLHEVLVDLAKLLAPCIPFLTERMYQNLVGSFAGPDTPESVHLCDYPQPRADRLDVDLSFRMAAVQQVVAVAHKLRDDAKVRVRQPLAELRVAWPQDQGDAKEQAARRAAVEQMANIIQDELNVKSVVTVESLQEMVSYQVRPNMKTLGAKHGKLVGKVRELVGQLNERQVASLRAGKSLSLSVDGATVELEPEDVLVTAEVISGWVFGEESCLQAALCTTLTVELEQEGIARDFVRHVQQLRKDADLEIQNRIAIRCACEDEAIRAALQTWCDYVCQETLADELTFATTEIAGKQVRVGSGSLQVTIERT
ncbi:MAG: class I tRNA ligase family protein [Planctomycetales bacterium]|nr:class I tRNA ligase family protein [Planctomycetales bacterium]